MVISLFAQRKYKKKEKKRNQKPLKSLLIDPETVPETKKHKTEAR